MTTTARRTGSTETDTEIASGEALFRARAHALHARVDGLFRWLLLGQWAFAIAIAIWYSPYAWEGRTRSIHVHVYLAIFLGGAVNSLPLFLVWKRRGAALTRYVIATAQMLWSALLIHLMGGRIETHFHVFGSLAFLSFYREWRVLVPATIVVTADHLGRQLFWPESVYGIVNPEWWRFLEHAGWVVFEDICLVVACVTGRAEMRGFSHQQVQIEFARRREMEIASHIQTSILPRQPGTSRLDISATMIPATEVGGDYYDVIPVDGGSWIGIGDVAGHGLTAGLVMMQVQSAIHSLVRASPDGSPRRLLELLNGVVYENVRKRMRSDEHVTLSLVRFHDDGRFAIAGAHEQAIICRAASGRAETLPTRGTWIGAVREIGAVTVDDEYRLETGDLLVLYTDGLIEAMDAKKEQFGPERLVAAIEAGRAKPLDDLRAEVFAAVSRWTFGANPDDVTLVLLRYRGAAVQSESAGEKPVIATAV